MGIAGLFSVKALTAFDSPATTLTHETIPPEPPKPLSGLRFTRSGPHRLVHMV